VLDVRLDFLEKDGFSVNRIWMQHITVPSGGDAAQRRQYRILSVRWLPGQIGVRD
jgi:hypothetical protein